MQGGPGPASKGPPLWLFIGLAIVFALGLGFLGSLGIRALGGDTNLLTSAVTAIIVGLFVAAILFGRQKKTDGASGPRVKGPFDLEEPKR